MINNILLSLFILFFFLTILHESIFFSIFFLICLFIVSSFIFIVLGFEFIGFLYLIVYVGAIAVLFLFMVMLFDKSEYLFFSKPSVDESHIYYKYIFYIAGFGISLAIVTQFYLLFGFCEETLLTFRSHFSHLISASMLDTEFKMDNFVNGGTNLQRIGFVLYNYFYLGVFGASLVLLIGMIGAIILTQTFFWGDRLKKHQEIKKQLVRKRVS